VEHGTTAKYWSILARNLKLFCTRWGNITNTKSAPIYVKSAEKVKIELADGKDNVLTDAEFYEFEDPQDNKPNACIYSRDDITIKGNGNLTVNADFNNGIGTSNDLKITGGNITVKL